MTTSATAEGTRAFFQGRAVHADKVRRLDDLTVSALAVGTYLGATDDATDRAAEEALVLAAQNGLNFFDTAVNYRCQRSERCIAYALKKLAGLGVPRKCMVVSSKGGFLPGDGSMQGFREYVFKCFINTGIITPEDIVENCHCMTPKYLDSQVRQSLANLKTDCIDLYYVHNPETQLPSVGETEFYRRLTAAFGKLEENIAAGRIRRYGIATWDGLRQGFGSENRIDLERVIACARDAGGADHHFKAVQLPYNLAMLEAVGIRGQRLGGEDYPIIPACVHHGIAVLISAPLMQGQVLRMPPRLESLMPGTASIAVKALQFVISSPGVVAAMVGMKSAAHVNEDLGALREPNLAVEELQRIGTALVR